MTALLVAVTFVALGVAGALLFYVLRLTREERDRSDARAAALAEMIGADQGALEFPFAESRTDASVRSIADRTELTPFEPERQHERAVDVDVVQPAWQEQSAVDEPRAPMFATSISDGSRPRRLLAPAIGMLILGLAVTVVWMWNRTETATAATTATAPLELVSLRHERQGDALVVSGLVRNPHAGRSIAGLSAVAFTFDRQGTFLASGRSMLDFPQLRGGDESPFSITLPQSAGVGRYRVSFRTDEGIVAHVDRRGEPTGATDAPSKH
jgi:hypothetical protein